MPLAVKPRASLEGQHFHVVIIGGGVNGVAVARECARAGKRTLLVEQNDFASGVTSRSTRIIHGGLRYLEHGELGLVRESLRERETLLRERSYLVQPLHFIVLLNEQSQRSAMKVRIGLWLYHRMAGKKATTSPAEIELARLQRALDTGRRWSMFNYEDAQCEFPERLVADWLREAIEAGAVVRNHSEVLAVDVTHGRARGVRLRDRTSKKDERVEASWILNCAGPWADRICQRSSVRTSHPLIGGVRGSHIVIGRFPGAPTAALYTEAPDGRPIFVLRGMSRFSSAPPKFPIPAIPEKPPRRPMRSNTCFDASRSYSPRQRFPRMTSSIRSLESALCLTPKESVLRISPAATSCTTMAMKAQRA